MAIFQANHRTGWKLFILLFLMRAGGLPTGTLDYTPAMYITAIARGLEAKYIKFFTRKELADTKR